MAGRARDPKAAAGHARLLARMAVLAQRVSKAEAGLSALREQRYKLGRRMNEAGIAWARIAAVSGRSKSALMEELQRRTRSGGATGG